MASTPDPWEDEGFGGEDDWGAPESLETDLEDEGGIGADELDGEDDGEDDLEPGM